MKNDIKYVLGLDIGIGSVGWAVVRDDDNPRIEKCGVEIFDSGEDSKKKNRYSQQRRAYRSARRLIRRRAFRKNRLKFYLSKVGIVNQQDLKLYFENKKDNDIISLRVKALDNEITPVELTACLINICNHRGYRDFYSYEGDDVSSEDKSDIESVDNIKSLMQAGKYRSIAEMYLKDSKFDNDGSAYRRYRNRDEYSEKFVAPREMLEQEVKDILLNQKRYNSKLTDEVISNVSSIIFATRDFEDGPGNTMDTNRQYKGFLDSIGTCMYYKNEERGSRYTYIADVYAIVNSLSQYKYIDMETGEICLPPVVAKALVEYAVKNAGITKRDIKGILSEYNYDFTSSDNGEKEPVNKAIKFLKAIKPILEDEGFDYNQVIQEDYLDVANTFLNVVGDKLSKYITPKRRISELSKISQLQGKDSLIKRISKLNISGTANVSYKYMQGAIEAFLGGELYGDYQARMNNNQVEEDSIKYDKLPPFNKDFEFYKNPVVLRSINETRKIINHIVELYGSPYAINIEVESDLNRTFEERGEIEREQKKNEKAKEIARQTIASLLDIGVAEVTDSMIERYRLGEQQNWHSLYSGKTIIKEDAIRNTNKVYEVDHIIPFSLILDNTLHNKVLVFANENQLKRQRTPLEYLSEDQAKLYLGTVNKMYKDKVISDKKYKYLTAKSISSCDDMIDEWKSRNINDTRYIAKFLVNYLKSSLKFRAKDDGDKYRPNIYAVKGAITSQMRRLWLDKTTWGMYDKQVLKDVTYLDHVADAIVIANCLPFYVEIASVKNKLNQVLKKNGNMPNEEYKNILETAVNSLNKFYGYSRERINYLLTQRGRIPSLIKDLGRETNLRLTDITTMQLFEGLKAKEAGREPKDINPNEVWCDFDTEKYIVYSTDISFAKSIKPIMTVHKRDQKATGKITDDMPKRRILVDGVTREVSRKSISSIALKDIDNLYTNDTKLKSRLIQLFNETGEATLDKALEKSGEKYLYTNDGKIIYKLSFLTNPIGRVLTKTISDTNYTLIPNSNYYCIEIYEDTDGHTMTTGITYSDIVTLDGKLWLNANYTYPENYAKHIMYLFTNDYIKITTNNILKCEGYFKSVKSIKGSLFYIALSNNSNNKIVSISKKDIVTKYDIDLLGDIGGEIKCGGQLLSIKERK